MSNSHLETGWKLIAQPIERDVLATKLPEPVMREIKLVGYTDTHHIMVRLRNGRTVEFTLDEWLTELCLARIAWEVL